MLKMKLINALRPSFNSELLVAPELSNSVKFGNSRKKFQRVQLLHLSLQCHLLNQQLALFNRSRINNVSAIPHLL